MSGAHLRSSVPTNHAVEAKGLETVARAASGGAPVKPGQKKRIWCKNNFHHEID